MECINRRKGNLGEIPQERRLRAGAAVFALGLVLAVAMVKLHAPPSLRLLLALPFFVGTSGLYMGLFGTCNGLAARGLRDGGDGPTSIADPSELSRVRRAALMVTALSFVSATLATSSFMFIR